MISLKRKNVRVTSSAPILLCLLLRQLTQTFGLQQCPALALFGKKPILSLRVQKDSVCSLLTSALSLSLATEGEYTQTAIAYNWDEQFEELQQFKSEYGHCNFPQNPSKTLKQKYPMLERFCQDQRRDYKPWQHNRKRSERMRTLADFDFQIRCRQLEKLGFEFNLQLASWYDSYHELLEYSRENGHTRVTGSENYVVARWIYTQRSRRNGEKGYTKLSDFQIKLLDDIGIEWESELRDAIWNEKYEELVAFRNKHGNFMIETNSTLYDWMTYQRLRRAGKKGYASISDQQLRLLDQIEFPWEADRLDAMWFTPYNELKRFYEENGHCRPVFSTHSRLYTWARDQKVKHRKGLLSKAQIELLNEIEFTWEGKLQEWLKMFNGLTQYVTTQGHIQVSQEDDPELFDWMDDQRRRYHGMGKLAMPEEQVEKLEELHFCWSFEWRDRLWHEKYTEAVEYFKEHGHVSVNQKENPSLYNWIQTQEKRYEGMEGQKPLSEEELEMLEQIDFPFMQGRPRMTWNAIFVKVTKYREGNDGRLPLSHKDDPDLSRWIRHQRYRYRSAYGYAPLSDEQNELLQSIDLSMYPNGKQARAWYEMYDELVVFWKEQGHFVVDMVEKPTLGHWIRVQRTCYNGSAYRHGPLLKMRLYLLERIGFTWTSDRYEIMWQQNYNELVEFLTTKGHFPTKSENKRLYAWSHNIRMRYKGIGMGTKLSENQIQQLEKIGFQWSAE